MFQRGFKTKCERIAQKYRADLGCKQAGPLDPFRLAKELNVQVCKASDFATLSEKSKRILFVDDADSWSAATVSWQGKYLVVLNQTHSSGRTNSNLTHELSHLIIGHSPARVDVTPDEVLILHTYDRTQEEEADWLCGCLLLPREALVTIKKQRLSEAVAAERYGVSTTMLKYRMNITGVSKQTSWMASR